MLLLTQCIYHKIEVGFSFVWVASNDKSRIPIFFLLVRYRPEILAQTGKQAEFIGKLMKHEKEKILTDTHTNEQDKN